MTKCNDTADICLAFSAPQRFIAPCVEEKRMLSINVPCPNKSPHLQTTCLVKHI